MNARSVILNRIRQARMSGVSLSNNDGPGVAVDNENAPIQDRRELMLSLPADVQQRISQPQTGIKPQLSGSLIDLLLENMQLVQMSFVRLQSDSEVVGAVDQYLQEHSIDGELRIAPALAGFDWPDTVMQGAAQASTVTSVTGAYCAIAETGSMVFESSPDTPATLNFLPENHIVVLYESQVHQHLEDVWAMFRSEGKIPSSQPDQSNASAPRALNIVTGPSRTGDIEQTIELGAHGPRRMHVLLVASQ